jgi:quinol monooxygenase YgiN
MTHDSAWQDGLGGGAGLVVIGRFRVDGADRAAFLAAAAEAVAVLAVQPGCRTVGLGQSTDDPDLLLLRSEWDGVGAYRRALSSFEVKMRAVPLLSRAIDEPSAFEIVLAADAGATVVRPSGLAADAHTVGLGESAGPRIPPVTT